MVSEKRRSKDKLKWALMDNFREFEVTDPFGRTWAAQFKYLQTAISIRHSDSVDVRYVLTSGDEGMQRTMVMQHADLRDYCARTGRKMSDAWCSRLAALKLRQSVQNAEDLDSAYLPVTPAEIDSFDHAIQAWEKEWLKEHAA